MKFRLVLEAERQDGSELFDVAVRAVDPPVTLAATTHADLNVACRQLVDIAAGRLQEAFDA